MPQSAVPGELEVLRLDDEHIDPTVDLHTARYRGRGDGMERWPVDGRRT